MSNEDREESEFVMHIACDSCGSSDANALYSDGHTHCFSCGATTQPDNSGTPAGRPAPRRKSKSLIEDGEATALTKRGINEHTARMFGYETGQHNGKPVQIANYRGTSGGRVAQKIRTKDKEFYWKGEPKDAQPLWGMHLWRDEGKMVVITEGEIDAMSVSQVQGNKWPVVSTKDGAGSAAKSVSKAIEWLEGFERVIFMLDQDEPGMEGAQEAAMCLSPGKARIAHLPLNDPNDMLRAGRGKEIIDAIWGAKTFRPDGIVRLGDIKEQALEPIKVGLPWWTPQLTVLTHGRRTGEIYTFGAGTGVGKTDFLAQQVVYDLIELGQPVAMFSLEQQPIETAKRLAGKHGRRRFHVPDDGWTSEELTEALDALDEQSNLYLYDHFGSTDWDIIRERIRYLARAEDVKLFYLDHLTALVSGTDNERVELERVMAEIGGLVKELDITLHLVSHLSTPDGKPHEEGGRVMVRHFKGSRAIGYWSHFIFGLERDLQDVEDPTTFRGLKDRFTGQATGEVIPLHYDPPTGLLSEAVSNPFASEDTSDDSSPF